MAAQLSFRGTETDRVSSFFGFPHCLHSLPIRFQRSVKSEQVAHMARTYIRSMFEIIVPSSGLVERVEQARKLWLHLVPMGPGWLQTTLAENEGWDVGTQEMWGAQALLWPLSGWISRCWNKKSLEFFLLAYPLPSLLCGWDHLTPHNMLTAGDLEQRQNLHRLQRTSVGNRLYDKRNPLGGYDQVGMGQQHNDTLKKWATSWWLKEIFLKFQIFIKMPRCLWRFLKCKWRWKCVQKLPEFSRERLCMEL